MIEQLNGMHETVRFSDDGSVRIYHNVEKEGYPLHWHSACEVVMPLREGYTVICQNNRIDMKQGDILWIGGGVLHEILEPEGGGERLYVQYDPRTLNEFSEFSAIAPMSAPAIFVTKESMPEMHDKLQDILLGVLRTEIERGYFKNVSIYADMMKFNAILFSALLNDQAMKAKLVIASEDDSKQSWDANHMSIIYGSCNYIRSHCHEPLNLDQVAEKTGFSKYYFSRLFKTYTQMSFIEYLNRCRVSEAEKLLADPSKTVTEVAMDCGFNSISTFNRVFKLTNNCTPAEYQRLAHRINAGGKPHGIEKHINEFVHNN